MKQFLICIFIFAFNGAILAQVGINNTSPKASLDITATNQATPSNTDGLLIPRIDTFPATAPTSAQQGMMVYLTTASGGNAPGYYYWDNNAGPAAWVSVVGSTIEKLDDLSDGKSDSDGTNDGSSVFLGINAGANDDSSANRNVGIGFQALFSNTTGFRNTVNGFESLYFNTTGSYNTANGNRSLYNNTTGNWNTASGSNSLYNNTTGFQNTANGYQSLYSNTIGNYNTANGVQALYNNTTGQQNTAIGFHSLFSNTTGNTNTAYGVQALNNNTTGIWNIASGYSSLYNNTTGSYNTASGNYSLYSNTIGNYNAVNGVQALYSNTTGYFNTALGNSAGYNSLGSSNVFLGSNAGYSETGSNKLYIENSNVDQDNALIYGEFDTNLLRTNGEFQIGNPTSTGYSFPTTDGTVNQILQTDGNGQLSFLNPNLGTDDQNITGSGLTGTNLTIGIENGTSQVIDLSSLQDTDWFEVGTTTAPNNINDNIYTNGFVGINNSTPNVELDVIGKTEITDITGASEYPLKVTRNAQTTGAAIFAETTSTYNLRSYSAILTENALTGLTTEMNKYTAGLGLRSGLIISGTDTWGKRGVVVDFITTSTINFAGENPAFLANITFNGGLAGPVYGFKAEIDGSGPAPKYGFYTKIPSTSGGDHYGIYSDVKNNNGYAGYFLGRVSIGSTTSNNYIFPSSRGTNGQIMSTNGAGDISWTTPIDTDDQIVDAFSLSGTTLNISLQDDGVVPVTVDLSSLQDGTGTDDQNITGSGLAGTNLTIGIENGTSQVIDLSSLQDGTGTDDQNITGSGLVGTNLIIGIENGTSQTIDLSSLQDGGALKIDDLLDGKSDNDGSDDGSSIYIGINAGVSDGGGNNQNVGMGFDALANSDNSANTAIGYKTLYSNVSGSGNTAIGWMSLNLNLGLMNTAIGSQSLSSNTAGSNNTALGNSAGKNNINGDNNIFLGNLSGFNETGSNKLYIESSNADANNALIYGEFDTNILRTNSQFQIGNPTVTGYAFPTTDGTLNQLMYTDGNGALSWINSTFIGTDDQTIDQFNLSGTTLNLSLENDGVAPLTIDLSSLQDGGALKIDDLTDGKSDNDGTNNNSSLFLGYFAGFSDDSTDNRNVGVGYFALSSNTIGLYNAAFGYNTLDANTTGNYNTAIGNLSLGSIISGDNNTALGRSAGGSNILGNGNVFLGFSSGFNETGSEKLYIENSGANEDSALIYGEFNTNILRTNSEFQIGNPTGTGFAFPTTDGNVNQVFQTNGTGSISWVDSSSVGTDNQNITSAVLTGSSLAISIENGTGATVDLSSLQDADWYETGGTAPNSIGDDIYTNGKVGINTTPDTRLHLKHFNNGTTGGFKLENANANSWRLYVSSGATGDFRFYSSVNGNALTAKIDGVSGVYTAVSDRRLKKDFNNLYFQWEEFMKLKPLTYRFKTQKNKKKYIGLVAQDVDKIYPELVSYTKDEDVYQLDYSATGIIAIKAVQELKKEVEILSQENQELKKQLKKYENLEARLSALEKNKDQIYLAKKANK